jgi:GH24 family phage-related lysozyme (muramidase)
MALSRTWLEDSRDEWRRRERSRFAKWREYRYNTTRGSKRMTVARRLALRAKWWASYQAAKANRVRREKQIAKLGRSVSNAGVALVAEFEGFEPRPYRDPVGIWTIGYGETEGISANTKPWTREYAARRLRERLNKDFMPAVLAANRNLTQNQLDGFTSFVYNVGPGGVSPSSRVGRNLRAGNVRAAADAILEWDKAGGRRLAGLTRRRRAERSLILK